MIITINGADIPVTIIRKRMKNMYIRIRRDRTVLVTAPRSAREEDIRRFVERERGWLEKHLTAMPEEPVYRYVDGESHYYLGQVVTLSVRQGGKTDVAFDSAAGRIVMTLSPQVQYPARVYARWAARSLMDMLDGLCRKWAPVMGVVYRSISIRNMKTRWGSCNVGTGALHFSLDLITKPPGCIEEVVVHELNHLLEPSHNARFHRLMAAWLPDYRERNRLLQHFPREFY